MTTIETINGNKITITWEFLFITDKHDSDFHEWALKGEGNDGKTYGGNCFADGNNPEDFYSEIIYLEEN